jgi:hypothetical protein
MRFNGEFILLKDGKATCYANDYHSVRGRLREDFRKDATSEYCIVQVVAVAQRPTIPTINSIYETP